jgi:hypothetical protein
VSRARPFPQFTEKAERLVKSHYFGKPSFAAPTVQLFGDQTKQTDSRKALEVAKMGAGSAADRQLGVSSVRDHRLLDELMEVTIGEHLDVGRRAKRQIVLQWKWNVRPCDP